MRHVNLPFRPDRSEENNRADIESPAKHPDDPWIFLLFLFFFIIILEIITSCH
jgi:hypothetical protein